MLHVLNIEGDKNPFADTYHIIFSVIKVDQSVSLESVLQAWSKNIDTIHE